jgi:hypothetical protein
MPIGFHYKIPTELVHVRYVHMMYDLMFYAYRISLQDSYGIM